METKSRHSDEKAREDLPVRDPKDVKGGAVNTTRFDPYKNFKF